MEGSVRLSPRQTEKEKVKDALVQACFECGPIQAERAYRAYASMFPEGDILMIEEVMNEPRPPVRALVCNYFKIGPYPAYHRLNMLGTGNLIRFWQSFSL